jgi:type IV pilus assembly protein PilW
MCASQSGQGRHERGLTLLELLVGIVLSLLLVLAAYGTSVVFTAAQRQAVSASATSAELTSTLAALKAEIAPAALGFVAGGANRCVKWNLSEGTFVANDQPFLPFAVTRDATTGHDTLEVVLTTDVKAATKVRLAANAFANAGSVMLRGWLPVTAGDRVLIAPKEPGDACSVRTVSSAEEGLPGPSYYFRLNLESATFGQPALGYFSNDTLSVLGQLDRRVIRVNSFGQLVMTSSLLGTGVEVPLLEGVMAWRVQYGVTDLVAGGNSIAWVNPEGAWASLSSTDMPRVRALRLGLLARSPQREKGCQATNTLPQLFGADVAVGSDPQWQCYRYRRAEVVVPLRNMVWGAS